MRLMVGVLCVGLLGCSKNAEEKPKGVEGKPAASPAPSTSPKAPVSAPAPATMSKLTCAKAVTAAMRDKYFKGATEEEMVEPAGVQCSFLIMEPEIMSLMLMWQCGAGSETSAIAEGKKRSEGAVDLPGIGRGAYQTSMLAGKDESTRIFTTQAWDDDTECYVTVAGTSKDTAAIAKDTLAAVTPDSLK